MKTAHIHIPFGFNGHLQYDSGDYMVWDAKKLQGIFWVRPNKKMEWQTAQGLQERGYKVVIL